MATFGIFLTSEEHTARELVETAQRAEDAGFGLAWLSDHYHPWVDSQGHSPFVWNVLGGIAATTDRLQVTTAVTCPTVRIHPAVVAQAAATTATMMPGRFRLGVGTGEALNEHITGARWPEADVRLEMLEEAIAVMRLLWQGGNHSHHGKHYTVENARLYDLPERPPEVLVSAFGPKALNLAIRVADGLITTSPDADSVSRFKQEAAGKVTQAGLKVCWGQDEAKCRRLAHELWPTTGVPGELSQELATPTHFEQVSQIVTEDMVAEKIVCGPDVERYVETVGKYVEAGFDEIYLSQVGPDQQGFLDFWTRELRPALER